MTSLLQGPAAPFGQPVERIKVKVRSHGMGSLQAVDRWLTHALAIEVGAQQADCVIKSGEDLRRAAIELLVTRVLLLSRVLLQAAGVPFFDKGRIFDIEPVHNETSTWWVTLGLARIDHLPAKAYQITLTETIRIVHWLSRTPLTPETREKLYSGITERVLRPLKNLVTGGKSTIHILRAAHQLNIPFYHLGAGVYQLGWGSKARRIDRSTTDSDSAIGMKLTRNKRWAAAVLRMAGLPAPIHGVASSPKAAVEVAHTLGWPLVVKPVDGERGEGVTVGVLADEQIPTAFERAQNASHTRTVLIERQVEGVCHRLFVAKGKLLYAVKRLPKSVHGDGKKTVSELIHEANQMEATMPPWMRSEPFALDALANQAISEAGFSTESVPMLNQRVPLRNIESTEWGGFDEDVTFELHPDNLNVALRAAAQFRLEVAGVDIISSDIKVPWHRNGAIINEVNFAPLLGGGVISRRLIPAFVRDLISGDGRIPIEIVLGGAEAISRAFDRQKKFADSNLRSFITSHEVTVDPQGNQVFFPFQGLYERTRALLLYEQVDALILAVQTDEILRRGLPVDRVDRLEVLSSGAHGSVPHIPSATAMKIQSLLTKDFGAVWQGV